MSEAQSSSNMITPAVVLARAATTPIGSITSLLLIEIGLAFQQPLGVISQIRTVQATIAVVFALLMGVISVKFKHKTLLLIGVVIIAISALGCYITPNFTFLLLVFPLAGIGTAMVAPMTNSLVGEHLTREKRAGAISWMMTGMAGISIIGRFIINYLNGIGGWRMAFLGYAVPVALLASVLVYFWIPQPKEETVSAISSEGLMSGYKRVYANKSALSCLLGMAISQTTWQALLLFSSSFYRQDFNISIGTMAFLGIGTTLGYIVGTLVSGKYVHRIGRKRLATISLLLSGVFMALLFIVPNFLVSYAFTLLFTLVSGMRATSTQSHTMEQMPSARGTLMSCMSAAISLGATLGAAIGGYILLGYSFVVFGYVFGAINILGALVFAFLTSEQS
jgi:predicted MFS family arabinose efflux permease